MLTFTPLDRSSFRPPSPFLSRHKSTQLITHSLVSSTHAFFRSINLLSPRFARTTPFFSLFFDSSQLRWLGPANSGSGCPRLRHLTANRWITRKPGNPWPFSRSWLFCSSPNIAYKSLFWFVLISSLGEGPKSGLFGCIIRLCSLKLWKSFDN